MADREDYYVGFDGGGTKTDCVLLNSAGEVLAEHSAGPANPLRAGFERAQSSLRTAAEKTLSSRQVGAASVAAVCAGIAGAGQPRVLKRVMAFLVDTFPRAHVQVCTDLEIALEAGLGDGPGIVVVAGTGSAALGRAPDGRQVRAGGDGPWVGDEGSAFDIGRRGVAAVARARDALAPVTTLADSIPAALDCPNWSALLERIAAGPDEVFPRIFPLVAEAAEAGDTPAREILFGAALSLSHLVLSVARRLEVAQQDFIVAEAGGVFGVSALLDQAFEALVRSAARGARIRPVAMPPARRRPPGPPHPFLRLRRRGRRERRLMARREPPADPRTASRDSLELLIGSADPEILLATLDNPALHESLLCRLLERKDAPAELLRRVAQRAQWIRSYPVKLRLARHPHTPRLIALACVRQLFLFDLARVSLLPSALAEVRRVAEDLVLNRLAQLPVGQKVTLAKQGPGRVAAALLAEGLPSTLAHVLENARLNEAQITRVLARADLSSRVVNAIARHPKWSNSPHVRIALLRHPLTPLARIMAFLPDIPLADLRDIMELTTVRPDLRLYLAHEVTRRTDRSRRP